jgi:hypothetical protein
MVWQAQPKVAFLVTFRTVGLCLDRNLQRFALTTGTGKSTGTGQGNGYAIPDSDLVPVAGTSEN